MGQLREAAEAYVIPNHRCSVAIIREQLTGDQVADFDYLLGQPKIGSANIAAQLKAICGLYISAGSVASHRRRECKCA